MERELIGGSIQIASAIISTLGVTLQRRAMMTEPDGTASHHEEGIREESFLQQPGTADGDHSSDYTLHGSDPDLGETRCARCWNRLRGTSKVWLLGFCMYYSSQLIEIIALSFASQSTIVAVSSVGVFLNAFVAVRVFHEPFLFYPPKQETTLWRKMFRWDAFNLATTVCGSVCTVIFAPRVPAKEEIQFDSDTLLKKWIEVPFVYYFGCGLLLVPVLLYRFFYIKAAPLTLAVSLAILSSFSITLSKITTELVERNDLFTTKSSVMISCWVFLLLLQIVLLQKGLKCFEQSGAFSVGGMLGGFLTILSGMLYYQTYRDFKYGDSGVIGFIIGIVLLLYGIFVFSQRRILTRDEMKRRLKLESHEQPLLSQSDPTMNRESLDDDDDGDASSAVDSAV